MQDNDYTKQKFLNDLYSKWLLTDMKTRIVQTICSLMDDQMYTKENAASSLIEVVALIELEERMVDTHKMKDNLLSKKIEM